MSRHAANEVGRRLEPKRRSSESRLLLLVQAHEIEGPHVTKSVGSRQSQYGRRRNGEETALFEPGRQLDGAGPEQNVGVEKRDQAQSVVDLVIDSPLELSPVDHQMIGPFLHVQGVQTHLRSIAPTGRLILQSKGIFGRWPLTAEHQVGRGLVEGILPLLGGGKLGPIGKRRKVGKDDIGLPHGSCGAGIPVTGKDPVLYVENIGVRRQRQPQQRDVGVRSATQRPLGTVQRELRRKGALVQVRSRYAVHLPHFPQENRLAKQGLRSPHKLEGIEVFLIGTQTPVRLREGADLLASSSDVTHAEILVGGQLGIQGKPQPTGVEVVVEILDQQLPPGSQARLAPTTNAEGIDPAQVGIRRALAGAWPETIEPHLAGEDLRGDLIQGIQIQDVHGGIPRHQRRVEHPEEPVGFEVQVA